MPQTGTKLKLSKIQKEFVAQHGLSPAKIYDAKGLPRSVYGPLMKELGMAVAVGVTPCAAFGHTMRNHYGNCVQCNPAVFAYSARYRSKGFVYLAYSQKKKLLKIGSTTNPAKRVTTLNGHRYAGASDWVIEFDAEVEQAGRVEAHIQHQLLGHKAAGSYVRAGIIQECSEIYSCSVDEGLGVYSAVLWKYWNNRLPDKPE